MGFARLFEHPATLIVLVLLFVVLFGWKKLPDMARSFGRSARILKSEADEFKRESAERSIGKSPQEDTAPGQRTVSDAPGPKNGMY